MTQQELENVASNNEEINPAVLNGNAEVAEVSKLRQAVPQFCAVGAKSWLLLTSSTTGAFSTILIPALQRDDSDIKVTLEELSWISSLNLFVGPLGCFMSGPASQYFGRRKVMLLANIPIVIVWIMFYYAKSTEMLFTALVLTGLTTGLLEAPVMTYVAEVTQPHLRGMLSAISEIAAMIGAFTQPVTGSLVSWRTACLINLIYPLICVVVLFMVPESPIWLAGKGRMQESEKSLCWLRGWVSPESVKTEFRAICDNVQQSKRRFLDSAEKAKPWKPYAQKTFYAPFAIIMFAFFVQAFGGMPPLHTFAVMIFAQLNAPINEYLATVILGVADLIGTLICAFAIHFTGKRKLFFWSLGGTGLCLLLAAVYGYSTSTGKLDANKYTWFSTTMMIGAAFLSKIGIGPLPWILAGEVFPTQVRSCASGVASSMNYIFSSIANKIFLYMVQGMTLSGTFFFYALVNIIGGIIFYFTLPETEGRTLQEIENHFAGIQSLKHKPQKAKLPVKEKWTATNPVPIRDDFECRL